tara:strand:+ start:1294 stop:2397 length:1104 start_codon:yes stop_codon:yes gene_type:complete
MKFTVSKTEIVKALSSTLGVVEKRQALPILSNILLTIEDNNISITATDLESEVKTTCAPISVESTGSTTAPAKKLNELCRLLPDGSEISIFLNGEKLSVESGSGKYSISTLPSEDFPVFDVVSENIEFTILGSVLRNLINKTAFAMGNQDWRHYLNGMYLNIEDKNITVVTTDAHRLAISTNTTTKSVSGEVSGIIPRKSINEIGKLLTDSSEEVTLSLGSNTIMLKTDSTSFVSKLIEGKFPNYEQVLPSGESSILSVNTKQLSEILSRVSVLSSDKFKGIKLNIKSNEILVSANNPEQEEGEESFKSNYSGEDMEIAFNVNYIQEVLSNIDSNDCNINLYGSDKSCLISPSDDPDLKYVVMPLLI